MTALAFLDTNIALYAMDKREPEKMRLAKEWISHLLDSQSLIVSPQVLNEMYWIGRQKFPQVPHAELKRFIGDFVPNCLAPLDATTTRAAFAIEDHYRLSWWDCLIVASALGARCHLLLTEDMQHGMTIQTLTILNPFRATPAEALSSG